MRCAIAFLSCWVGFAAVEAAELRVPEDFPVIQWAVNAASAGDTVVVSKGKYHENVVVDGHDGIVLRAEGKVTIDGGGGGAGPAILVQNSQDVVIKGFRLRGGSSGLDIRSGPVLVEDVEVRASSSSGIFVNSDLVTVRDCRVEEAIGNGIWVLADSVLIDGCVVHGVSGDGIQIEGNDVTVIDCELSQTGTAIVIEARYAPDVLSGMLIAGNTIKKCDDGIVVQRAEAIPLGVEGTTIHGNTIVKPSLRGLVVEGLTESFVIGNNTVYKAGDDAVVIEGDDHVVSGNTVKKPDGSGFVVVGLGAFCEGNLSKKAGGYGFRIEGADGHYLGNTSKRSGLGGLFVDGSGNYLAGNDFD